MWSHSYSMTWVTCFAVNTPPYNYALCAPSDPDHDFPTCMLYYYVHLTKCCLYHDNYLPNSYAHFYQMWWARISLSLLLLKVIPARQVNYHKMKWLLAGVQWIALLTGTIYYRYNSSETAIENLMHWKQNACSEKFQLFSWCHVGLGHWHAS